MAITQQDVVLFKGVHCNENTIVARLLREHFAGMLKEPILDVGAGLGDISASAFPNMNVIHLDVLDYTNHPIPTKHVRLRGDFFDYEPQGPTGSAMFCHVLQFIDDDVVRLNAKIAELQPEAVLTVVNANDDFMANLIEWFAKHAGGSNAEIDVAGFPAGYTLVHDVPFTACIRCSDYESLVEQVSFLMDRELTRAVRRKLRQYLEHHLDEPTFSINEHIRLYK